MEDKTLTNTQEPCIALQPLVIHGVVSIRDIKRVVYTVIGDNKHFFWDDMVNESVLSILKLGKGHKKAYYLRSAKFACMRFLTKHCKGIVPFSRISNFPDVIDYLIYESCSLPRGKPNKNGYYNNSDQMKERVKKDPRLQTNWKLNNPKIIVDIRNKAKNGISNNDLAKEYGVRLEAICNIVFGRTYKDYGGPIQPAPGCFVPKDETEIVGSPKRRLGLSAIFLAYKNDRKSISYKDQNFYDNVLSIAGVSNKDIPIDKSYAKTPTHYLKGIMRGLKMFTPNANGKEFIVRLNV